MGLLKKLFVILILIFPLAEVGRVQLSNGVAFSINDIIVFILLSFWISKKIGKKEGLKGHLLKPLFLFIGVCTYSLLLNLPNLGFEKAAISSMYLVRFTSYALLYLVFKEFDSKFRRKLSYLMLFSGFITVILGYLQFYLYPSLRNLYYLGWDEHLYRMFGTFLDPNFAGTFFVLFLVFTLTFIKNPLSKEELVNKIIYVFISLVTLGAIFLTYSRSAIIMLLVSLFVYLLLINQKKLLLVFAAILLLLIALSPKSFQTEGTNILRVTSSKARLKTIEQAVQIIRENYVYGVGFNAYRYAQNEKGLNNREWQVTHSGAGTDNSFLFVTATTGTVGLFVFVLLVYKLIELGKINLKKNSYSKALIAIVLGLIVNSFFINSFFYIFILEWVFLTAAITESN